MIRPLEWIPGYTPKAAVLSGATYLCDWQVFVDYEFIRFVLINNSGGPVTVTPEASEDALHIVTSPTAPEPFDVADNYASDRGFGPYDMRSYWRVSANGTGSVIWGIRGIKRAG